jgi:hypothetical protein
VAEELGDVKEFERTRLNAPGRRHGVDGYPAGIGCPGCRSLYAEVCELRRRVKDLEAEKGGSDERGDI